MSILAGLVLIHSGLLAWAAYRDSFTWDEVGFLPAGISHWQFGNFDLFRVNPPLVRMIAAIPVLFADPVLDWSAYTDSIYVRSEIPIGETLLENNGQRAFLLLAFARWACIPFSLIGMLVCYRWARELFGDAAGLFAAGLWCFEPNIMGHGHLITPDVGATAFGVTAFFAFRRWLLQPNWKTTFIAGILFGFVQLTKTTWTVLYVAWPLIWLAWRLTGQRSEQAFSWRMQTLHLVAIFTIGLLVINSIYGFEGSFQRLDQYRFLSKTLGAKVRPGHEKKPEAGNRFAGTLLGRLPVPFPRNYIQGIDRQKHHFEKPDNSYLAGKWRDRGWYHYYIYAMYVKVPTGIWLLGYLSAVVAVGRRGYAAARRDEWLLIVPIAVILVLVSSQTGFNRHLRYVLPVFPFTFILISRLARAVTLRHPGLLALGCCGYAWAVLSSLLIYPHSLSYFNELAGGPTNGDAHLLSSNTDWGQDLLYMKRWYEAHPEARPFHLAWNVRVVDPRVAGIEYEPVPVVPTPGWHALSVNQIRSRTKDHLYFLKLKPVAMAGYSIRIYHLTEEDCEALLSTMYEIPVR